MKNINVIFEDDEFDLLDSIKGDKSWREFILTLCTSKRNKGEKK